jgi:hypothetical protein
MTPYDYRLPRSHPTLPDNKKDIKTVRFRSCFCIILDDIDAFQPRGQRNLEDVDISRSFGNSASRRKGKQAKATLVAPHIAAVVKGTRHPASLSILGAVATSCLLFWISPRFASFVQPPCSTPVVSTMTPFCHLAAFKYPTAPTNDQLVRWADYSTLVVLQIRTFDDLIEEIVGTKAFAKKMKKAEMAAHDLVTIVKVGDSTDKGQIIEKLDQFAEDAKRAGRILFSLGVKIQGALDS